MVRMCIGHKLGKSGGKIGYEYGKVGYATHISALTKSQLIHKRIILYLTLLINYLAATHFFQCICRGFCK